MKENTTVHIVYVVGVVFSHVVLKLTPSADRLVKFYLTFCPGHCLVVPRETRAERQRLDMRIWARNSESLVYILERRVDISVAVETLTFNDSISRENT